MAEPKEFWEKQKETALANMAVLWPMITKARTKLNDLQNTHDGCQARLYEAERHLIEVIKLKPAESAKVRNTHWMKQIKSLSPEERKTLVTKLEGRLRMKEKESISISIPAG